LSNQASTVSVKQSSASHVNKYRIKWKCDINNDRKYNGVGRKQALEKHDFKTTGNNEQ